MERSISADRAVELLTAGVRPVGTEWVPVQAALGRVLAEEIRAEQNVPPFARSPLDGYAFRSADTCAASAEMPAELRVIAQTPAGAAPAGPVGRGEAVKVSTGAPVPEGADCVIAYERTEFTAHTVRIGQPCAPGNIVPIGEDVCAGQRLAPEGSVVTGGLMGLLAGQGMQKIPVYRRPSVCVISTGTELREAGQPLSRGQIYNSNGTTLCALLRMLGAEPQNAGILPDDPYAIAAEISARLETADLVITTGGASVGEFDYARSAAVLAGGTVLYHKASFKPGGAMLGAVRGERRILSLSGNPGAAAVGLLRVGAPLIHCLAGRREPGFPKIQVRLAQDFPKESCCQRLLRGSLRIEAGQALFSLHEGQNNGSVRAVQGMNLLAELPAHSSPLPAGTLVDAYWLGGLECGL